MRLILIAFLLTACQAADSQESDCLAVHRLAEIATSKSVSALKANSGQRVDYARGLVAAYRTLPLHADPDSATALLRLIPANESEQLAVTTLGDSLCSQESLSEMTALGHIRDDLPKALSKAVVIVPSSSHSSWNMRSRLPLTRTATSRCRW